MEKNQYIYSSKTKKHKNVYLLNFLIFGSQMEGTFNCIWARVFAGYELKEKSWFISWIKFLALSWKYERF